MSEQPEATEGPFVNPHTAASQELIVELRSMRERVPKLVIPTSRDANRRLARAASVPEGCVLQTASMIENHQELVRNGAPDADEMRDLIAYAKAYEGFANELEVLMIHVRHSVKAARNKAGSETLMTYAIGQRLAKRPETAYLQPLVDIMRRALGRRKKKRAQAPADDSPASTPATPE